jgi:hypothetical protein
MRHMCFCSREENLKRKQTSLCSDNISGGRDGVAER